MATTHTGSCACAAIKIEIQGDPQMVGLCHCHSCQKSSSSAFSTNWVIPKPSFTLLSGTPNTFAVKGGSGNPVQRKFCGTCGSSLWTESEMFPDIVVVKAGIVDGGGIMKFKPGLEAFTCRRPEWVGRVEGAREFVEGYKA